MRIFLSYAREDRALVLPYYTKLSEAGYSPWIDVRGILPGQNWEAEIDRAFTDANVVMLFLSPRSVSKRGFVQREANDAIEQLRYKLPTDVYVIPVLLEACEVPTQISKRLHYVDLNSADSWEQLEGSLKLAASQQNLEIREGATHGPFRVFTLEHREEWVGKPGYIAEIKYPRFESETHNKVARELTDYFSGRAAKILIDFRQAPWDQAPELFPESSLSAQNGHWESFSVSLASSQILSLNFVVGWYGAGAAHPNTHFETFNFSLQDRLVTFELADLFSDPQRGLSKLSVICQRELQKEYWERTHEPPDEAIIKWIGDGASAEWDRFSAFTLTHRGIVVHFPPYQVGPYAAGSWSVEISFFELLETLTPNGIHTMVIPKN